MEQVRVWHDSPASCATLREVCRWRITEADASWFRLLASVGLVGIPNRSGTELAEELWRSDYYTDDEIARRARITIATVKALRRTVFRDAQWVSQAAGKYAKAYRLV